MKAELINLLGSGYSMKEASYCVAEKYYLSQRQVLRVYYQTVIREEGIVMSGQGTAGRTDAEIQ